MSGAVLELLERIFAVEQSCGLFERATLGLDCVHPDETEFEAEPYDVDDVVLPFDRILGDWVDISVDK